MTTATKNAVSIIKSILPELDWNEIKPAEYEQVFQTLMAAGTFNASAAQFMKQAKIRLGLHQQYKSGAGWTVLRDITLAPEEKLLDPYTLCLISHELFHIQQSLLNRLSVRGELLAWQYQIKSYHELTGMDIGDHGQAYGGTKVYWDQIALLNPDSRDDLLKAQVLMKKVSPDYRSDCLPLFPLMKEVGFYLGKGRIKDAYDVVWNLITCK
ncbi:MAG: hypothetical protein ABI904_05565 [Chloroflexota bacterium]